MPYKDKEIEKMYFSISEVAKQFNVAKKTTKGNRLYSKKDIENFRLIHHLVKEKGYTLDGAKKKLKEGGIDKTDANAEIITRLKKIRSFLESMYNEL